MGTADCPECQTATPTPAAGSDDPLVGQTVAGGQYRVLRRVGAGGFGVVYEVETVVGGLRRALKVLRDSWAQHPKARDRFVNEARVLEQVNHPHVARCYSAGVLDDGALYLLFEFIDGASLDALLADAQGRPTPLPPLRVVRLARQIAAGLAAAHERRVLHRDLKPANLLITKAGTSEERVKLLDFGVARIVEHDATITAELVGTPAYMAPEQFSGAAPPTPATDLWQLGATMFAMLTGRPPYLGDGESIDDLRSRLRPAGAPGPAPSEIDPALTSHPALDRFVASLLASSPADRPASAIDVSEDLARIEHTLAPPPTSARSALLEALCAHPSAGSWVALARYLQGQDDAMRAAAESRLAHWPHALRRAAQGWWQATRRGDPHALWPLVRHLDLSGRALSDADAEQLAASPTLRGIRALSLAHNQIGPDGIASLAASPHLDALESLDLSGNRVDARGLQAIAASRSLSRLTSLRLASARVDTKSLQALGGAAFRLRRLDLSENHLRTEGAEALSRLPLGRLESLALRGNLIGPDGVALLAVSTLFSSLRDLDLGRNAIGPSGAATLAVSRHLGELRRLDLSQNNLGREGLQLLLASSGLERLEELMLASNGFGANGVMALAASMLARRLRSLDVGDNALGDAGLAALIGAPQLTGLTTLGLAQNDLTPAGIGLFDGAALQVDALDLSGNSLGDDGARHLGAALGHLRVRRLAVRRASLTGPALSTIVEGGLGSIAELGASDNALGPDGIRALAQCRELAQVRRLALDRTGATGRGACELASSPHVTALASLSLASNAVGDEGVEEVVVRSGLAGLESLSLADNGIGPDGAAALAASSLASRLRFLDLGFNRLGDAGAEAIAHGPEWPQLAELRLRTNNISLAGASALLASTSLEVLQVVELSDNPLRGELDLRALPEDKVALLESTFARLSGDGAGFTGRFYARLFETFPGVKPMFARTSMSRQRQHLFAALTLVVDNLRTPEAIESGLREMGRRHAGYGVSPSQYYAVVSAMLDVLGETLGEAWTEPVQDAWSDGLDAVVRVMLDGHRFGPAGPHPGVRSATGARASTDDDVAAERAAPASSG